MKRTESKQIWAERIAAWKASGLKQRAFCERESLPYQSFLWWRRQLRRDARDTGLVPVVALAPATVAAKKAIKSLPMPLGEAGVISDGIEIRLQGGRVLALHGRLNEVQLRQLIRLLETPPC
jgi:hypothetical protein